MNNYIYKVKNTLFAFSKESKKLKRPSYEDLKKYQDFQRKENNYLALSFGSGKSGQNWFSKIFNSHSNWVGTCERFADYEAFYRYVCYYDLPIYKDEFFNLMQLSSKRDMAIHQNSFISSPYLSLGVEELTNKLKPNYIFFNIRNPVNTVEALYNRGWYKYFDNKKIKSPSIDISITQYKSFSRIIPKGEFLEEWLNLSRIGKLTWFWSTINMAIYDGFNKTKNVDKFFVKLEDVNQNFNVYEKLSERFDFKDIMTKKQFYNVINKAHNNDINKKYEYKDWNDIEKKEFEKIINNVFPYYDKINSNI